MYIYISLFSVSRTQPSAQQELGTSASCPGCRAMDLHQQEKACVPNQRSKPEEKGSAKRRQKPRKSQRRFRVAWTNHQQSFATKLLTALQFSRRRIRRRKQRKSWRRAERRPNKIRIQTSCQFSYYYLGFLYP